MKPYRNRRLTMGAIEEPDGSVRFVNWIKKLIAVAALRRAGIENTAIEKTGLSSAFGERKKEEVVYTKPSEQLFSLIRVLLPPLFTMSSGILCRCSIR